MMIADCEICERKQVPCKSCQESQRAICYRCDGDVDDPYCEMTDSRSQPMNAEDVFDKARAWDVVAAKNTEIYALKARITELEAECDRWRKGLEVIANSSTFYGSTCRELARVQLNPKAGS